MRHPLAILWSILLVTAVAHPARLIAADPKPAAQPAPATPGTTTGQHSTATNQANASSTTKQKKIDLNQATVAELETLPGIGAATANAIIQARPYKSIDELTNVAGIGPSKFSKLKSQVMVKSQTTHRSASPTAGEQTTEKARTTTPSAPTPYGVTKETTVPKTTKPSTPQATKVPSAQAAHGAKVNLNTASKEELDALPGIGPTKAQAIIDARPFTSIEDVKRAKGIKEGTFSQIKDRITVE